MPSVRTQTEEGEDCCEACLEDIKSGECLLRWNAVYLRKMRSYEGGLAERNIHKERDKNKSWVQCKKLEVMGDEISVKMIEEFKEIFK